MSINKQGKLTVENLILTLRMASLGVSTIGSLGNVLNDVLRTIGTPVRLKKFEMNA